MAAQPYYRPTRDELRKAIYHDHTYCIPASSVDSDDQLHSHTIPCIISDLTVQTTLKSVPSPQQFCIEQIAEDKKAILFYTSSFSTYACFMICFNFPGDAVNHLTYRGSSTTIVSWRATCKCQRSLSPKNEFFLTLWRLRCGLMEQDLAYRFAISQATVSWICVVWINFLYCKFSEVPIWPSRHQIQELIPTQFKVQYPNTRIIIDATEIFIQKPSNPHAQQSTFSFYKNRNTAKALAGITPSGAFSFISPLFGGSISDRKLVIQSGLIEKLEVGDAIIFQKGGLTYQWCLA